MYPERIHDSADLEEIYALRVAAWRARVESFPDIGQWIDAEDARAAHWAIRDGGRIIAAARLSIHDSLAEVPHAEIFDGVFSGAMEGPVGSINRLVVSISNRRQGHSEALDRVRINYALENGCRHVVGATSAGQGRLRQLGLLGFSVVGQSRPYVPGPATMAKAKSGGANDGGSRVPTIIHLSLQC